jgi:hypothetical protein
MHITTCKAPGTVSDGGVSIFKTDKSKKEEFGYWQEQELQPNRPHPDREVVLRKTDFIFFTPDKH